MSTDALLNTLPFLLLASAAASTWFARVLAKKLKALGHSVEEPWRWWIHVLLFIPFVNFLMLFHYISVGPLLVALLGVPVSLAFNRARWSPELHRDARLLVGALSLAWLAYGAYELAMRGEKETIVGAPIRLDLFLFGPFLYYSSLKALWAYLSALKSGTNS